MIDRDTTGHWYLYARSLRVISKGLMAMTWCGALPLCPRSPKGRRTTAWIERLRIDLGVLIVKLGITRVQLCLPGCRRELGVSLLMLNMLHS
jgi:hypothetical protein